MDSNESRRYDIPTRAEQSAFLLRLYFGSNSDGLTACVARAYFDLKRTLTGFAKFADATVLRSNAHAFVRSALVTLSRIDGANQSEFDDWHRSSCEGLCQLYADKKFAFAVGQAQKWINMALKYVYVFGEDRIPGFSPLYGFGHVPLDTVMLGAFAKSGAPPLSSAWSRLRSYSEYYGFQKWIRAKFPGCAPLAVEFNLWHAIGTPETTTDLLGSNGSKILVERSGSVENAEKLETLIRGLLLRRYRFPNIPEVAGTGIYAFFLIDHKALPGITVDTSGVLYIGMSNTSIAARNHIFHSTSSGSTFRRSLGAVLKGKLKLRAIPRGLQKSTKSINNYQFEKPGEEKLTSWMVANLEYSYISVKTDIEVVEGKIIEELQPPLNIDKCSNSQKEMLSSLRKICRDEAKLV